MPLKSLNDLLVEELKDIYSAEKQITKALPKLAKAANSPDLVAAFEKHLEETKLQIQTLDQVFEMIGAKPGRKICLAMQGLVAEGDELLEKELPKAEPATFDAALIAAAQRVEHYEIAAYGSARTFAENCGFKDAAKLLQQILDQESKTNETLTKLAEGGINEMALEGSGAA